MDIDLSSHSAEQLEDLGESFFTELAARKTPVRVLHRLSDAALENLCISAVEWLSGRKKAAHPTTWARRENATGLLELVGFRPLSNELLLHIAAGSWNEMLKRHLDSTGDERTWWDRVRIDLAMKIFPEVPEMANQHERARLIVTMVQQRFGPMVGAAKHKKERQEKRNQRAHQLLTDRNLQMYGLDAVYVFMCREEPGLMAKGSGKVALSTFRKSYRRWLKTHEGGTNGTAGKDK